MAIQFNGNNLHANFTVNTPARTLNTNFTPDTGRPVFCIYSVEINSGDSEDGLVELRSDTAATPTTVRSSGRNQFNVTGILGVGGNSITTAQLSYLVPPGHNVRLVTTNTTGTPTFTLKDQTEITL